MLIDISGLQIAPHPETRNWIVVYEPLAVDLPESAHPYCCYLTHVIFYRSKEDRTVLAEVDHQIRYSLHGNTILKYGDQRFVLMTGQVVYYNNQWHCRWIAYKTNGLLEEGGAGYWCQGECVFVQASNGLEAVNKYRKELSEAQIPVNCQIPDAIAKRSTQEKLQRLEQVLSLAEEALGEVWGACDKEHWKLVSRALQEIGTYRSRMLPGVDKGVLF